MTKPEIRYAYYEYRGIECYCRLIQDKGYTSRAWCIKEYPNGLITREIRNYLSSIFTETKTNYKFENLFSIFLLSE